MVFKNKETAIKYLLRKHLKIKGNLLLSERLFVVNSILDWVFKNVNNQKVIEWYIADLEKYIRGKVQVGWIEKLLNNNERRDKNDYKASEAKEKGRSRKQ
jgi:hypothetical protein